jgi:hypothetical protein
MLASAMGAPVARRLLSTKEEVAVQSAKGEAEQAAAQWVPGWAGAGWVAPGWVGAGWAGASAAQVGPGWGWGGWGYGPWGYGASTWVPGAGTWYSKGLGGATVGGFVDVGRR